MSELKSLEFERSELWRRLAALDDRIAKLRYQDNRDEIIAAGLDPDKRYFVDPEYANWYRENVHQSGIDSAFMKYPVIVQWVHDKNAYVETDEPYARSCTSMPIRFLRPE